MGLCRRTTLSLTKTAHNIPTGISDSLDSHGADNMMSGCGTLSAGCSAKWIVTAEASKNSSEEGVLVDEEVLGSMSAEGTR
jgi:hypothetical protein